MQVFPASDTKILYKFTKILCEFILVVPNYGNGGDF